MSEIAQETKAETMYSPLWYYFYGFERFSKKQILILKCYQNWKYQLNGAGLVCSN